MVNETGKLFCGEPKFICSIIHLFVCYLHVQTVIHKLSATSPTCSMAIYRLKLCFVSQHSFFMLV